MAVRNDFYEKCETFSVILVSGVGESERGADRLTDTPCSVMRR
jgi:hypothetical protein